MAIVSLTTLKNYFLTKKKPTQSNFNDLIDTLNASASVEVGTFSLSSNGMSATGGILTNPGLVNPTLTITTTKRLQLANFICSSEQLNYSNGSDNGIISACTGRNSNADSFSINDQSIFVSENIPLAWQGRIVDIRATEFDIEFTLPQGGYTAGSSLNATWNGIMSNQF